MYSRFDRIIKCMALDMLNEIDAPVSHLVGVRLVVVLNLENKTRARTTNFDEANYSVDKEDNERAEGERGCLLTTTDYCYHPLRIASSPAKDGSKRCAGRLEWHRCIQQGAMLSFCVV